jgi:hypothetical protein
MAISDFSSRERIRASVRHFSFIQERAKQATVRLRQWNFRLVSVLSSISWWPYLAAQCAKPLPWRPWRLPQTRSRICFAAQWIALKTHERRAAATFPRFSIASAPGVTEGVFSLEFLAIAVLKSMDEIQIQKQYQFILFTP